MICIFKKLILFFTFCICSISIYSTNIGVLYNNKITAHKEIFEKFKINCIIEGHLVHSVRYEKKNVQQMTANIKNSKCDFIFTIGTDCTKAAVNAGIPGVFTLVVNPIKHGLMDKSLNPLTKLTGILIEIAPEKQVALLQNILLDKTHGGIIHNPETHGYLIQKHTDAWSGEGYRIVGFPANPTDDVPPIIESMKKHVNYILSVVDPRIYSSNNLQIMIRFSLTNKIPFIGFSTQHTKNGALAAFYSNFTELGNQAFVLMQKIVTNPGATVPLEWPNEIKYSVNLQSAEILKIPIQERFKANADKIYGD